jgi:hypothetical protein
MAAKQEALVKYIEAVTQGPEAAGEFARTLDDETALYVYEGCIKLGLGHRLVRTLWYDYDRQCIRATHRARMG